MLTGKLYDIPKDKIAMVMTHLEMTKRAATRDVPLPDGVSFRKVTPDVAWYRDVFERVGSRWLWFGRCLVPDDALLGILTDTDIEIYTLAQDGQDEALLELDFRTQGACELAYFGLTNKLIGTGAGRALMDRAIARAWARDINRFHLHTCSIDSPQALPFYMRSGFVPTHVQVEIDDDPRLTGLLPRTAAPHVPILG